MGRVHSSRPRYRREKNIPRSFVLDDKSTVIRSLVIFLAVAPSAILAREQSPYRPTFRKVSGLPADRAVISRREVLSVPRLNRYIGSRFGTRRSFEEETDERATFTISLVETPSSPSPLFTPVPGGQRRFSLERAKFSTYESVKLVESYRTAVNPRKKVDLADPDWPGPARTAPWTRSILDASRTRELSAVRAAIVRTSVSRTFDSRARFSLRGKIQVQR